MAIPKNITRLFYGIAKLCFFGFAIFNAQNTQAQISAPIPIRETQTNQAQIIKPQERTVELTVPLSERGVYLGDLDVEMRGDEPYFNAGRVADLLARVASANAISRIRVKEPAGKINVKDLQDIGIETKWDSSELAINVIISASDKEKREIEVADLDRDDKIDFVKPAKFALFSNIRTSLDYNHFGSNLGFNDPFFDLSLNGRLFGIAFDNELNYSSDGKGLKRESTQLVFDNQKRAIRTLIGDIRPQSGGFSGGGAQIFGLSIASAYQAIQPQRNLRPRGSGSFILDKPSEVDVVINDRVVNHLRLDAGSYDLKDFPFLQGENRVQFVAQDKTGRREIAKFDVFFDRELLAQNLSEWAINVGSTTKRGLRGIEYDNGNFFLSAFHRRGINSALTIGANIQLINSAGQIGTEAIHANRLGVFTFDFNTSWAKMGNGNSLSLRFNRNLGSTNNKSATPINWGLNFSYRDRLFGSTDLSRANNSQVFDTSLFWSMQMKNNVSVFANANYAKGRDSVIDTSSIRFGLNRRLNSRFSLSSDISYIQNQRGDSIEFKLQFTSRFGRSGNSSMTYETRNSRFGLSAHQNGQSQYGNWSIGGNLDKSETASGLNANGFIGTNRADLGLSHSTSYDNDFAKVTSERTSLQIATAIGIADGVLAWGRPIQNAFAIPVAHETLKGRKLIIDGASGSGAVNSSMLGPPLIGSISNYSRRDVSIDVDELPAGYDLGSGIMSLRAPYNAGYKLIIGNADNLTIIARALDPDGNPIRLIAGIVERNSDKKRTELFTNGRGVFSASGLGPGNWDITLYTKPNATKINLKIEKSDEAIRRLGDLKGVPE